MLLIRCLFFVCVVLYSVGAIQTTDAACYNLKSVFCTGQGGGGCATKACSVEYHGGMGPGDPVVPIYTCNTSDAFRTRNVTYIIGQPYESGEGGDSIITGSTFTYCTEGQTCAVNLPCSGGYCTANTGWMSYPPSKKFDVVFAQNSVSCP